MCMRCLLCTPKMFTALLQQGSHKVASSFGCPTPLANPESNGTSEKIMLFLPTGCKMWEKQPTHLSKRLPRHLTTARAEGQVLMKWPVYVFSVHVALITGVCALIHALKESQEVRLGTPAWCVGLSPGRVQQAGEVPVLYACKAPNLCLGHGHVHHPVQQSHAAQHETIQSHPESLATPVSQFLEGFGVPGGLPVLETC